MSHDNGGGIESWERIVKKMLGAVAHRVLTCVFLLCVTTPSFAQVAPEVTRGLLWLTQQVQPDGTLSGQATSIAAPLQSRAESATAFKLLSTVPPSLVDAIAADTENNTEYLARQVMALVGSGRDASAQTRDLLSRQNSNGGFGAALDYASNPLDTAFALMAMNKANVVSPINTSSFSNAINYLLLTQNANGGYGLDDNLPGSYLSALVSTALQMSPTSPDLMISVNKTNIWLLSMQQADGTWGTVANTCLVYLALAGTTSDTALQDSVTAAILARQDANGAWNGDPYVSALALRALVARPLSQPANGNVVGQVSDASTGQAVVGAVVLIQQLSGLQGASDTGGKFALSNLPAGSYSMTISAPGYTAKVLAFVAKNANTADVGVVALAPDSGIIQGVATDAGTGLPLNGVSVTVVGKNIVSAVTQVDGSYTLSGVTPGAIKLSASKSGYARVAAEGSVVAGAVQAFSPSLKTLVTTGGITGRVVDGVSQLALAGVSVAVGVAPAVITGADGRFNVSGMAAGTAVATISLAGYAPKALSAIIAAGSIADFQNITLDKTAPPPSKTGVIQGLVKDDATGLPLAGVAITVGGSVNLTSNTGANGSFSLPLVKPGNVTLTASKAGYANAVGAGSVVAGATIVFSPRLQLVPSTGITGQLVDSVSKAPLAGVAVALDGATSSTVSDATGRFSFLKVTGGNHTLAFVLSGYAAKSVPLLVSAGIVADLQAIALVKSATMIALSGKVSDSKTQQGIAKANVSILGSGFSALTDSAGNYRIENITPGLATVRYGALGYTGETVTLNLSTLGEVSLDRALQPGQGASLTLALSTDQPHYAAYAPLSIQAQVHNSGGQAMAGAISATIVDEQGNYIDSIEATRTDANGIVTSSVDFPPGDTGVALTWNSRAVPPGNYTIVARLRQAQAASTTSGAIELAQQRASFVVDPTQAIESVRITPLPAYANVGAVEHIGFKIDAVNRSNIVVSSKLSYQLQTPTLALIAGGAVTLDLLPGESSKSILLDGVQYKFVESGAHPSTLTAVDGTMPAQLTGMPIAVAPGTRIELLHTITPAAITPDGDKRIRIDIRLQGVEQK